MIALAFLLAVGQVAPAEVPLQEQDARCLVLLIESVAISKEDPDRQALIPLVTYFLGRVKARDPGLTLSTEMTRLRSDRSALKDIMARDSDRCTQELRRLSTEIGGIDQQR